MNDKDYSVESEDEWYEDAFTISPSNEKVEELLAEARKDSNIDLRRALKELLYVRFLMQKLVEFVIEEDEDNEFLTIQKLAKFYVEGTERANNLKKTQKKNNVENEN